MKHYVNGIESDVLRKKVGFPWLLTFLVLLGFELILVLVFLRHWRLPSILEYLKIIVIAVVLYVECIGILSLFQYYNRHRIKLFCLENGETEMVIESDGRVWKVPFEDIKEAQYRSGSYLEERGFTIKTNEGNIGISCLGDRLNLVKNPEKDIEQFDQFFTEFVEKTKPFLEDDRSTYGTLSSLVRLRKIK